MSDNIDPIFLSVAKTAEILSLSTKEVYQLVNVGVLTSARNRRPDGTPGRKLLVDYASVLAYADACRQPA